MIALLIANSQNILVSILCPKALVIEVMLACLLTRYQPKKTSLHLQICADQSCLHFCSEMQIPAHHLTTTMALALSRKNRFTNFAGIHSGINVEHKVTNTVQKQPTPPKGISFINLAKPSPSSLNQGTVTTKESPVQIGTCEDQSAFHKTQNKVEIPKKLPAVTPKGINFLSFGQGSVSSFKNAIHSNVSRENGIKIPQLFNFGLPEQANSSLNKDSYNKASDIRKQNVPQTDLFLNEILGKNQSVAERMTSKPPEKTSVDVFMRNHSHSRDQFKREKHHLIFLKVQRAKRHSYQLWHLQQSMNLTLR